MIFDCFTFFNELDLLELRLTILDDAVDRFVLCEAPFTFRGNAKPLVFAEHRERFARWSDRIVHLVYDAPPDENPWKNEWGQRAFLTTGLAGAAPDDLVLIGDADEIPDPRNAARRPQPGRVLVHRQQFSSGYVNRVHGPWLGTRALAAGDLGNRTLNDIRLLARGELDAIDGGWHFSSLGGSAAVASKMLSYAHAESAIAYYTDERRLALELSSTPDVRWVPLDDTFPAALHHPRWSSYVWPEPSAAAATVLPAMLHAHGCFASLPADVAAVTVVCDRDRDVWERVGAERFGDRFAGVSASVADAVRRVPRNGWALIDGLERWSRDALAALAAAGIDVVAFARNARSFATLAAVLAGAAFPRGWARGFAECSAIVDAAGFDIERSDRVVTRAIFAPAELLSPDSAPFTATIGPFHFAEATRETIGNFVAEAFVFRLRVRTTRGAS